MGRREARFRRALTLLEVLISLGLIAALVGAMLTFMWQVVDVRDAATEAADRMQIARQVLSKIEAELRGCVGFEQFNFPIETPLVEEDVFNEGQDVAQAETEAIPAGTVPLLVGDRRHITFLTARLPAESQYGFRSPDDYVPPAQHDLTQVSYWLWVDPEKTDENGEPIIGGIIRTEKKTLNQYIVELDDPLDVRNDLWSHELGYLEFRYFDGVDWDTKWDVTEGNSLPQLIQVTVGFKPCSTDELENRDLEEYPLEEFPYGDDRDHPDRYSIIVRIPAADRFFGSRIQRLGKQMTELLGVEGL